MKNDLIENNELLPEGLTRRRGVFYADFRLNGVRYRQSLETDKITLAKHRLKEIIAQAANGQLDRSDAFTLSVSEWCQEYKATHLVTRVKRSSVECARQLEKEIVPYLGANKLLSEISTAKLIRLRSELWGQTSAATQNRKMALVKHFFAEARRRKLIENDPARDVASLRELSNPSRTLSEFELKRLFIACPEPLRTFVKLAAFTGLRLGELQHLRWKNLEYDGKHGLCWVKLANQDGFRTKSGRVRAVPFNPKFLPDLAERIGRSNPEDLVFAPPLGGNVFHPRRDWRRVIKRLGIKGFTFHGLRRSYGTLLHKGGVPIGTVQKLMGHASVLQTRAYIDVHAEDLVVSVGCMDKAFNFQESEEVWSQFGHTETKVVESR